MRPFSVTGTAGTTLASLAIPASGRDRTRIQYLNATSDKAASLLTFKKVSITTTVTATGATSQAIVTAPPYAGAAANDVVLLQSAETGQVARAVVSAVSVENGTITLTANLPFTMKAGDKVYLTTTAGQIAVGAATKELDAATVFAVEEGPVLLELDGTSACRINLVSGEFL